MERSQHVDSYFLCGFVVSLLTSITYHVMNQRWKAAIPIQERSKAESVHESEIKNEKTQREARIAVFIKSRNGKFAKSD